MVSCPRCGRPNAPHKAACLYCGEALPNPQAPPPQRPQRALPEDFGALVADALRRGNTSKLERALSEAEAAPESHAPAVASLALSSPVSHSPAAVFPQAVSPEPPPPERLAPAQPSTPEAAPPAGSPPEPPAPSLPELLPQLTAAALGAERAWAQGQHADTRAALHTLMTAAAAALAALPEEEEPAGVEPAEDAPSPAEPTAEPTVELTVELPAFRMAWVLVIDGPGDAARAPDLAAALELDLATARLLSVSRPLKVAARASEPEALREKAARVRAQMGLGASVLGRADLEAVGLPEILLAWEPGRFTLTQAPVWRADPEQVRGLEGELREGLTPTLAVPGEVVVRRFRQSAGGGRYGRNRESRLSVANERRLGVLDLHGEGIFLRAVEGLGQLGDAGQASTRLRFQGFCEALVEALPGVRLEPRRICRVTGTPRVPEGHDPAAPIEASGWAEFEEHTRLARLHVMGGPGR